MSNWTREDVHHLDVLIAEVVEHTEGLTAMPGVESVRNRIAARVGIETQPEGGITWETVRETDYGDHREAPTSDAGGVA